MQIWHTLELAAAPNARLLQLQNILLSVLSFTWISMPMTVSYVGIGLGEFYSIRGIEAYAAIDNGQPQ